MKLVRFLVIILVVFLAAYFIWDRYGKNRTKLCFSGKVVDNAGKAIVSASVEVGGIETQTTENGEFKLCVKPSKRFVLNVTKLGFGLASKVYLDTASNITITMTTATVVEADPAEEIVIEDTTPEVKPPLSADIGSVSSPLDTIPFIYDSNGRLIGFGAPQAIQDTYDAAEQFEQPQTGATVEVPADALVDPTETDEAGMFFQSKKGEKVTASLSTVDIYATDGMPGDNTVELGNGATGFMETYGAVEVSFFRNGKELQLKKGMSATLTIPVDTITRIYYGKKLPEKMPLLTYNKNTGRWKRDGENFGILNKERNAYIAKIAHFSVFNMDEEFAMPVCYKMCTSGVPTNATMEVSVPGHIKPFYPFGAGCIAPNGCPAGQDAHAVIYMKPNTPMGVRIADGVTGEVKSTYVFIAGDGTAAHTTSCNFTTCSGPATIRFTECWMNSATPGTMTAPIMALKQTGTNYDFTLLYIDPVNTGTANTTLYYYSIEYKSQPNSDTDFDPNTGWTKVDFDAGAGQRFTHPNAITGTTDWKTDLPGVAFSGGTTNNAPPASDFIFFRVNYGTNSANPDGFTKGVIYAINLPTSGLFFNDFETDVSCYIK